MLAKVISEIKPDDIPKIIWPELKLPPPIGTPSFYSTSNRATHDRMRMLVAEKSLRQAEPLNLYRPMRTQEEFHASDAYVRLAVGSNRSGKTVGAVIEFARAVLNCDPYGKYPKSGVAYVVGKSLKHIGDTIYRKLFQPGLFQIIRGEDGRWEAYEPWNVNHMMRESEAIMSHPLISDRYILEEAWESKVENEISMSRLSTGWEIRYFSARSQLPQGNSVDLVLFDEEIVDSMNGPWIPEMLARTVDREGKIIWSASPQNGYENLSELMAQSDMQMERYRSNPTVNPPPDVVTFDMKIEDNKFQKQRAVERFGRMLSEDERKIRFEGISAATSLRMYPEFSLQMHGFPMMVPPDTWTRIAITDPGRTICGVLFVAVPPLAECPGMLPTVVIYDELYIPLCNAVKYGEEMKAKIGDSVFEDFIGDGQGLRPTDIGHGRSVGDQYSEQLEKHKISSRISGFNFTYASSDRKAGVLKVHEFLHQRKGGRPRLLVAVSPDDHSVCACPNFYSEIKKYRKKRIAGIIVDEAEDRGYTHLMQCMRYLCMYDPQYKAPEVLSSGYKAFMTLKKWSESVNKRDGNTSINFGPG